MVDDYVEEVLGLVERIPKGRVMSYSAIAEYLSERSGRGSPRVVGNIMSRYGGAVPWHRVVTVSGRVVPFHVAEATARLRAEGVPFVDGKVDMRRAAWYPNDDPPATIGDLLRQWREQRRLSQLELAVQAEVSTRHLSFVETGRASPSREMVLHLAEELDVPLRERNALLLAAGYAPLYVERRLDSPRMSAVRAAVGDILTAHEPNPAVVIDRHWNVVDANAGLSLFIDGVADHLRQPPINVLRLSLDPQGAAPRIVNLGQWRAHLLARLRRQIARSSDPELTRLYTEARGSPRDGEEPMVDVPGPDDVVVPLRFRYKEQELAFFSTVAVFGTPLDITVEELAIELFFPSDASTAAFLNEQAIVR